MDSFEETVGEWHNTRYVVKSNSTNGTDTISRPVYSIADDAFKGISNIKQMEIPSTVALVGDSAFEGCTNLESVTLSTNCKSIGKKAFANSSKLNSIDLNYATMLEKIGDGAFANTGYRTPYSFSYRTFLLLSDLSSSGISSPAFLPTIYLPCIRSERH